MAMTFQLASNPLPTDQMARNYAAAGSANDIPAKTIVAIDKTNFVSVTGDDVGVVTAVGATAGEALYGVAIEKLVASGTSGAVRTAGRAVIVAHGAINAGDVVMASGTALHLGQGKTQTTGLPQIGYALTTAADGEDCLIQLHIANNA